MNANVYDDAGLLLGTIALPSKVFSTGNTGFYGNTKLEIKGKRYQVQCQLVAIKAAVKAEPVKTVKAEPAVTVGKINASSLPLSTDKVTAQLAERMGKMESDLALLVSALKVAM